MKRVARQTCQRRQERHCEQRRDARDRVVDRGCHAGVPRLRRAKHGRRQRRNRQRQTQPIHNDRRQHRGHVVGARADTRHQQHAAAVTSGPTVIGTRGPIRCASAPAGEDRNSRSNVVGSVAKPACSGE